MKGIARKRPRTKVATLTVLASWLLGAACRPAVQMSLQEFQANPEAYEGKRILIETDIGTLLKNPGDYDKRRVVLTGRVDYWVSADPSRWDFALSDESGPSVSCIQTKHEAGEWLWVERVAQDAALKHESLTVVGRFEQSRIEVDAIRYQGLWFDSDYPRDFSARP
ncbi:MAG: hypothetical protein AB1898_31430 [Acidobacteriota bacterium]